MLGVTTGSNEALLKEVVHKIFPEEIILGNVRKETEVRNPKTGTFLEVDLWIPTKSLCFEFQDHYHYGTTWYSQVPLSSVQNNDAVKRHTLLSREETLVSIPFWWDGDDDSLRASVGFQRPDVFLQAEPSPAPIPLNPVGEFSDSCVPGVGELMLASFPHSPTQFQQSISKENSWWMGEKYDGIRFCWNADLQKSYRRSGLDLFLPEKIKCHLGRTFIDGELWCGRGSFSEAQQLIHSHSDIDWTFLRIVAFDVPDPRFSGLSFEARFSKILTHIPSDHSFMVVVPRLSCSDGSLLASTTNSVLEDGGEGMILRKPESTYVHGKTDLLVKFKGSMADAEALVISVQADIATLKLPNGDEFEIDLSLQNPENLEIQKGDIVSFSFDKYSRQSVPTTISKIRKDISWEEVVKNWNESGDTSASLHLGNTKTQKTRDFLLNFARRKFFDPEIAENWYSIKASLVYRQKGAAAALAMYGGSMVKALFDVFPNIGLEKSKFAFLQKKYWNVVGNRRKFFVDFARKNKFDPLIPENWYGIKHYDILSKKSGFSVLDHYGGSHVSALLTLFPEIGLEKTKFSPSLQRSQRDNSNNRKLFFVRFASKRGFDPLVPENWYKVRRKDVLSLKHGKRVLQYYNGSLSKAIIALFPDIGLDLSQFSKVFWSDPENRKQFFKNFATERGFNYLVSENWYKIKHSDIATTKNGLKVLGYHQGSHITALVSLFPEISWQRSEFYASWKEPENRKMFFKQFADSKGFDPLSPKNWYQISQNDIANFQGGRTVLSYHQNDYISALTDLFPDIGVNRSLFPENYWKSFENRKQFFVDFAATNGFDASVPEFWYKIRLRSVQDSKNGRTVLSFHRGSHIEALLDLFPELGLQREYFPKKRGRV